MAFKRAFVPRAHHSNRRRQTFSLTRQRYMLPMLLLAATAAVVAHLLIMRATPWLYDVWGWRLPTENTPDQVENDEEIRVVVREQTTEELPEAEPIEMPDDPAEIEDVMHEPTEIDMLDMEDMQELVMAPGETNLVMPEPEPDQKPDTAIADELAPRELDMAALGNSVLPEQAELLPEPTPINANSVIANATPQTKALEDAEGLIETELRRQAREGRGDMPSDTRSLADLMGTSNLGSSSGVARLGADLLFGFNESKLKNSARISLLQLAALIHKNPNTRFIIEGHTDSIGSDDYNALLSLLRASAVCDWLIQNGVPVKNVYMRACGSSRPLADVRAPRDKQALNRRVEIHMRRANENLPLGCLPATHPVDRITPVQTQLKYGVKPPTVSK